LKLDFKAEPPGNKGGRRNRYAPFGYGTGTPALREVSGGAARLRAPASIRASRVLRAKSAPNPESTATLRRAEGARDWGRGSATRARPPKRHSQHRWARAQSAAECAAVTARLRGRRHRPNHRGRRGQACLAPRADRRPGRLRSRRPQALQRTSPPTESRSSNAPSRRTTP